LTGLFIPTVATRSLFAFSLRAAITMALAMFATLFCAVAAADERNSLFPQFLVVDYHPLTKTRVAGSPAQAPLYDYVYRVDVRNGGAAAGEVSGKISSASKSVVAVDADASFGAVGAYRVKASSDTIVLRAGSYFDRRLDPRQNRGGVWSYSDDGRDGGDSQIPGLGLGSVNANATDAFLDWYYDIKFQFLFKWSFSTRGEQSAPVISQLLPQGMSNAARPTLSAAYSDASGIDLSQIVLVVDGVDVSAKASKTSAGVSYRPAANLSEGVHTATLSVTDKARNTATASWSFLVDSRAPLIADPSPSEINNASPTALISASYTDPGGTGINPDKVTLRVDRIDQTARATRTVNGISYLPSKKLADGNHTVQLTVQDNAGNSTSAEWRFGVDSRGVSIVNTLPAEGSVLAVSALPKVSAGFVATGTSVDLAKTSLFIDGVNLSAKANVTASGISYTPTTAFAEGVHSVKLAITDKRGNLSQASWSFITRSVPEITDVTPTDVVLNAQSVIALTAKYRDDGAGIDPARTRLLLDGVDVTALARHDATSLSMTPAAPLAQGTHVATLSVSDTAGNTTARTWRFALDSGLPVISQQTPRDVLLANGLVRISASYQDTASPADPAGSTGIDTGKVTLRVDNVDVTARAQVDATRIGYTPAVALAGGTHAVSLSVADKAGNVVDSVWSFRVDGDIPTVPGDVTPANGSILPADALPLVSASYSDAGSGIDPGRVQLEVDGVDVTALAQVSATGVRYTPAAPLAEGSHSVKLTVADKGGNAAVQSWGFITRSVPVIGSESPFNAVVLSTATRRPQVSATIADVGSGIDKSKTRLVIDGADVTAQAHVDAHGIVYGFPADLPDSTHTVALSVVDLAGNSASSAWEFRLETPPQFGTVGPQDVMLPAGSRPTLFAELKNMGTGIEQVRMLLNNVDVTGEASISDTAIRYTPAQALPAGRYLAAVQVANARGVFVFKAWDFEVDIPRTWRVQIVSPADQAVSAQASIEIVVAVDSNVSYASDVRINGVEADQVPATEGAGAGFSATIPLHEGDNAVLVQVTFSDGTIRTQSTSVRYSSAPTVTIASPLDRVTLGPASPNSPRDLTGKVERAVAITGNTSKPVASVSINQQAAVLDASGTTFRFDNFFLHEGTNLLSAVATDDQGRIGTASITVSVDQTAPYLSVESPEKNAVTSNAMLDLRGIVNDAIEGGFNTPYVTVRVTNKANARTVTAKVSDRYYIAEDVPLEVGNNELTVEAIDNAGNVRSLNQPVTRIASGSSRLTMLSGNRQRGPLNVALAKPLSVVALAKDGNPLARTAVTFDVLRGTGSLSATANGAAPARNLQVLTDDAGRAQVWMKLGKQSGEAGNMVRAANPAFGEDVVFTASGEKGAPAFIRADAGTAQYGETSSGAMESLTAVVVDQDDNRLADETVLFTVDSGDAAFIDASQTKVRSLSVKTDKNGLAAARPVFGTEAGKVHVSAMVQQGAGQTGIASANYQITVLEAREGPTRFSGTILSHTGTPLAGVRVSIGRTSLSTTTNLAGYFIFDGMVPAGKLDLFIDGRTANAQSGQYPSLHFEALAIRGQDNILPHLIYLPPLLLEQAKVVGGDQDVTLTMPGFDGFAMTVKANSVTFPDGARTGTLVVSPVQQDKLPMVPPGGYAGFMAPAWTIQPSGTRFDPPIQVRIPNTQNLKAGETREIFQWDHDLATFVPMGRATVSEDAALLVSDIGSGVSKAGWGGPPSPPPAPPKCATNNMPSVDTVLINVPDQEQSDEIVTLAGKLQAFRADVKYKNCTPQYEWDFDGEKKTGANPSVKFKDPKKVAISLKFKCKATCTGIPDSPERTVFRDVHVAKVELTEAWNDQYDGAEATGWITGQNKTGTVEKSYALAGVRLADDTGRVRLKYKLEPNTEAVRKRIRFAMTDGTNLFGESGGKKDASGDITSDQAYLKVISPGLTDLNPVVGLLKVGKTKLAIADLSSTASQPTWKFRMISNAEYGRALGDFDAGVTLFGTVGRNWLNAFRNGTSPPGTSSSNGFALDRLEKGLTHAAGAAFNAEGNLTQGPSRRDVFPPTSNIVNEVVRNPGFISWIRSGIAEDSVMTRVSMLATGQKVLVRRSTLNKTLTLIVGTTGPADLYAAIGATNAISVEVEVKYVMSGDDRTPEFTATDVRIVKGAIQDLFDWDYDVTAKGIDFASRIPDVTPILGRMALMARAAAKIQASHGGIGSARPGGLVFDNEYQLTGVKLAPFLLNEKDYSD
jgi:PKD repeat protein